VDRARDSKLQGSIKRAEAALRFGLKIGSLGNVKTTTLKAFDEEEIPSVIDKLR